MMKTCAALAAAAVAAFGLFSAVAEGLPEQLQHLDALAKDEAKLLEAVRTFDKEQSAATDNDLETIKKLLKEGKAEEAQAAQKTAVERVQNIRKAYEFLLAQFPNNARGHNYLGELLYDRFGEQTAALKEWNLAISLDSKFGAPYNNLGIHYFHLGQYEQGLQAYDEALKLEPDHPDYLFNLAQAYLLYSPQIMEIKKWKKARVYKEAMKMSKKAAEVSPDDFTLVQDYANNFYAAENFDMKADWAEAAKAWQNARRLARNPDETFFTWLNEGRCWIRQGNKAKATECLNEALKLRPDSEVPKNLLEKLRQGVEIVPKDQPKSSPKSSPKNFAGPAKTASR